MATKLRLYRPSTLWQPGLAANFNYSGPNGANTETFQSYMTKKERYQGSDMSNPSSMLSFLDDVAQDGAYSATVRTQAALNSAIAKMLTTSMNLMFEQEPTAPVWNASTGKPTHNNSNVSVFNKAQVKPRGTGILGSLLSLGAGILKDVIPGQIDDTIIDILAQEVSPGGGTVKRWLGNQFTKDLWGIANAVSPLSYPFTVTFPSSDRTGIKGLVPRVPSEIYNGNTESRPDRRLQTMPSIPPGGEKPLVGDILGVPAEAGDPPSTYPVQRAPNGDPVYDGLPPVPNFVQAVALAKNLNAGFKKYSY